MNYPVDVNNLDIGGFTDIGQRVHNEDKFLIDPELGLVVVADGVGGHDAGEVASELTCVAIQREIAAGSSLAHAIDRANEQVISAVEQGRGEQGMGSTVVAFLATGNGYELAWLGDSRAYLWDGKLSLLTRDHSFVEAQLASGQISLEEARHHPHKNVILQAVGLQTTDNLKIGENSGRLAPNSCLLLCTDGITDPLDSERLCQLLAKRTTAGETCQSMVKTALKYGGRDNATAVLIAHTGGEGNPLEVAGPAQVVWVYDPATGECAGLLDTTISQRGRGDAVTGVQKATQVQRIKPRSASSELPAYQDSSRNAGAEGRARVRRYGWLIALLGILAIALAYIAR